MLGGATATGAPTPPRPTAGDQELRRAARAFEGQVLGALLAPMFEGLRTDGPFGGGGAEAQWRPMLVEAIARDLAGGRGLGIGDAVLRELVRMQEQLNNGEGP